MGVRTGDTKGGVRKRHSNGKGGPADYDGSMPLSDSREERYAQNVISGEFDSQHAAFVAAGYADHRGNATRVFNKPQFQKRIRWLQEQVRERTMITVESVTRMMLEDRERAHEKDQIGPAVTSSMNLAKLHGLVVDRKHHTFKNVDDMNERELREFLGLSDGDGA